MSQAAVELLGLTKDYPVGFWHNRKKRALDSVTFHVEQGEVFGFLGPNGAGKSTTLKLLMGLIFPTAGAAKIQGRPIGDITIRREIGFLPEDPYFYDYLTPRELLDYFARFFGYDADERSKRVNHNLERVGVAAAANVQLRKLSKGMLQRVGIAQAILHDPQIIFLDEPMSGLDPLGRRDVRDIILQLKQEGRTVFFSTHILSDAEMLCDRVAVLTGGKLQGVGSPTDMLSVQIQGMEILCQLSDERQLPEFLEARTTRTGNRYRIEVTEPELYDALDQLRRAQARILSVTPLRPTLEDFFFRLIQRERVPESHELEVALK